MIWVTEEQKNKKKITGRGWRYYIIYRNPPALIKIEKHKTGNVLIT